MTDALQHLESIIRARRAADPETSYVAKLTQRGRTRITQKLGEEAIETVIAAIANNHEEVIKESADLLFHLIILFADMGLSINDVYAELERREGVSGLAEKASRGAQ